MPRVIYIAHPIGGDVSGNAQRVLDIMRSMHGRQAFPIAPYLAVIQYLDDGNKIERIRGMTANWIHFSRRFIDEVWLFGDRISAGMQKEIRWARQYGIPVIASTRELERELIALELAAGDYVRTRGVGPCPPTVARLLRIDGDELTLRLRCATNPKKTLTPTVNITDLAYLVPLTAAAPC